MSSRGIIFTSESVRAILAGQKTQTRRLSGTFAAGDELWVRETWRTEELKRGPCVGDDGIRFKADNAFVRIRSTMAAADRWVDAHDNGKHGTSWRPSLFLPRWAARITLEVLAVRVEKLQDITEDDIHAEGVGGDLITEQCDDTCRFHTSEERRYALRKAWMLGWDAINGARAPWSTNPEVRVITFRRTKP